MAYLLCSFEKMLLHFNCNKNEWKWFLDILWNFTCVECIEDWVYQVAEMLPESILEDKFDEKDVEYLTILQYQKLKLMYSKVCEDILVIIRLIFELGEAEIYSRILNYSPKTLSKLKKSIQIFNDIGIELPDIADFEIYKISECDGWGICFNGENRYSLYK